LEQGDMVLHTDKIKKIFEDILSGKICREEANQWAWEIMQLYQQERLTFVLPPPVVDGLWEDAILYLFQVDYQSYPNVYDITISEIEEHYEKKIIPYDDLSSITAKHIEDLWVTCQYQDCLEIFEVSVCDKYIECPKCYNIMINPLFRST